MTAGHTDSRSEPAVPQPSSEIVVIVRTTSRCLQHLPLQVIDLLRGFEAFRQSAKPLCGAAAGEEEQEDCGGQGGDTQSGWSASLCTQRGQKAGDHRPPLPKEVLTEQSEEQGKQFRDVRWRRAPGEETVRVPVPDGRGKSILVPG
jgi:hypothetical protein